MRFFPALTEEFTSPLPPAELLRRVQASVQQQRDFTGTVQADRFLISRVIDYRNSMLPRIEGWVTAALGGGSRLRLHHRLAVFTLIFGAVWLLLVGGVALATLPALVQAGLAEQWTDVFGPSLIPLGMLAFGVLLLTVPFWLEVRQSRPRLLALLQLQLAALPGAG